MSRAAIRMGDDGVNGRERPMMAHATTPIGEALAEAVLRRERALARRVPRAFAGDVRAVHRARVASRRLREVLAAAAVHVGGVARVRRAVRRLTRALGPVREMDVALEELDRAARRHGWTEAQVAAVRRRLETLKARGGARLVQAARYHRARLRDRCRRLADRLPVSATEAEWQQALASRVGRRVDEARAAARGCGTRYAPERLHRLRIAIKKLRYTLELMPRTPGLDAAAELSTLRQAQEQFGRLHDIEVLLAEVRALQAKKRPARGDAGLASVAQALERECREIHAGVLPRIAAVDASARNIRRALDVRSASLRPRMAKAEASVASRPVGGVVHARR
jgi:CHAD domain-containing protein